MSDRIQFRLKSVDDYAIELETKYEQEFGGDAMSASLEEMWHQALEENDGDADAAGRMVNVDFAKSLITRTCVEKSLLELLEFAVAQVVALTACMADTLEFLKVYQSSGDVDESNPQEVEELTTRLGIAVEEITVSMQEYVDATNANEAMYERLSTFAKELADYKLSISVKEGAN